MKHPGWQHLTSQHDCASEVVEPFLKARRSIRTYQSRPVDRGTLGRVIDFARYAPSGVNCQPVRWLVVQEREEVRRLAGIVVDWMRGAVRDNPALAGRFGLGRLVAGWDAGRDPVCRSAPHLIVAYACWSRKGSRLCKSRVERERVRS